MKKRDLARRLREECEVVKRLEHQHYLDGLRIAEFQEALRTWDAAALQRFARQLAPPGQFPAEEVMTPATESST